MGLCERHFELDPVFAEQDLHTLVVGREQPDVAVLAERHDLEVVADVRLEQRLAGGYHRRGSGRQSGDQLCLRGRDRLDRAQQLEVHGSDADDHADVGLCDPHELRDLTGAAHRHLEHQHLGPGRRGEDLQRQPDLGVVVAARGDRAPVRSEHCEQQILG